MRSKNRSRNGSDLRRAIGSWGAGAFVVTNMVGTGIFTIPAFVRVATGNGLASLGVWIAGAGMALCGALCYAELATRMPKAGGEYHFLTRIYGPLWGFLSGWVSFLVGFSAAIAAAALGAVAYAAAALPAWNPSAPLLDGLGISQGAAAAAAMAVGLAIFHTVGVRPSGRLQTMLAGLVIGAIVVLVAAGLGSKRGNWQGAFLGPTESGLWWVALLEVSFAYSGWNAAAYLAGEVANPLRTLPRSLIGGTVVVTVAYLALNVLFLYALPADGWEPTIAVGQLAAQRLFGPVGAQIVSLIIALAIIGSISAMTATGPRVYYAMARDGLAPSIFGRVSQRSRTPRIAILTQAAMATALALSGAFEALLIYIGSSLLLFAGLTVAAVYIVPRPQEQDGARFFRVPGYPVTPAVFIILVAVAWFQGLVERPLPTGAALLTVLAGVVIYRIGQRRGWLPGAPTVEISQSFSVNHEDAASQAEK